jgi:hypothetical protein
MRTSAQDTGAANCSRTATRRPSTSCSAVAMPVRPTMAKVPAPRWAARHPWASAHGVQPNAECAQQGVTRTRAEHVVHGRESRHVEQQRRVGPRLAGSGGFTQQTCTVGQAGDRVRVRDRLDARIAFLQRFGHRVECHADPLDLARTGQARHTDARPQVAGGDLAGGVGQVGHRTGHTAADAPGQQRCSSQGQQGDDNELGLCSTHPVGGARLPAGDRVLLGLREIPGQRHEPVEGGLSIGREQGRSPRRLTGFDPDADLGEGLAVAVPRCVKRLHQGQRIGLGDALLQLRRQAVHRGRLGVQRWVDGLALSARCREQTRHGRAVALRMRRQFLQRQQAGPFLAVHTVGGQLHRPQVPGREGDHEQHQGQQGCEGHGQLSRQGGRQGPRDGARPRRRHAFRRLGRLIRHLIGIGCLAGPLSIAALRRPLDRGAQTACRRVSCGLAATLTGASFVAIGPRTGAVADTSQMPRNLNLSAPTAQTRRRRTLPAC